MLHVCMYSWTPWPWRGIRLGCCKCHGVACEWSLPRVWVRPPGTNSNLKHLYSVDPLSTVDDLNPAWFYVRKLPKPIGNGSVVCIGCDWVMQDIHHEQYLYIVAPPRPHKPPYLAYLPRSPEHPRRAVIQSRSHVTGSVDGGKLLQRLWRTCGFWDPILGSGDPVLGSWDPILGSWDPTLGSGDPSMLPWSSRSRYFMPRGYYIASQRVPSTHYSWLVLQNLCLRWLQEQETLSFGYLDPLGLGDGVHYVLFLRMPLSIFGLFRDCSWTVGSCFPDCSFQQPALTLSTQSSNCPDSAVPLDSVFLGEPGCLTGERSLHQTAAKFLS